MIQQHEFSIGPFRKGFHRIENQIINVIGELPETGMLHVFVKHTSAGVMINENADPDVLTDINTLFDRLSPENDPEYRHTMEGADDMPAHFKSLLAGNSVTVPITNHRLNLGVWQGIYFCEFRNYGGPRKLVVTLYS